MLRAGLLDEVRTHLDLGRGEWYPLRSVGYKESVEVLNGALEESKVEDEIVKNTMRLAKRQMTWFRKNSDIQWINGRRKFRRNFARTKQCTGLTFLVLILVIR